MKFKISLIAAIILSLAFSAVTFAASRNVTVQNKTGRDIKAIYISPVAEDDWERCRISDDIIFDGESEVVYFRTQRHVDYWDVRCVYLNGRTEIWYGVDLEDGDILVLRRNGRFSMEDGY